MAEKFIEEIYENAIVIDWLREYVSLAVKCDYSEARKTYNKAIKQIEKLLPQYATIDLEAAKNIQNIAENIIQNWDDNSFVSGTIVGKLIPAWFKFMSFFANIEVEDQGYLLKSSESGFLTLKDKYTGFYFHDIHDPMNEADQIAEIIYKPNMEEMIIFGAGLGYVPYKVWKKSFGTIKIKLYEECPEVIAYAKQYGVLSWIDEEYIEIISNQDSERLLEDFLKAAEGNVAKACIYISPQKRKRYFNSLDGQFEYMAAVLSYEWSLKRLVQINYQKNKKRKNVDFDKLSEKISGNEWILVAAGPSLDDNIEFLRINQGKKKIVAVNTVIKRLSKEGIVPDVIVAADSNEQLLEHIDGIEEFTANIPLIADWVTSWEFIERYKGEVCFVDTPSDIDIKDISGDIWDVSGTVASLAMEAALRFGAGKIYLIGLDLAYPEGKNYAGGAAHELSQVKRNRITVKDVNGKDVETVPTFITFKKIIEKKIADNSNIIFYNLSKQGAFINGTCIMQEEEA